MTRYQRGLLVLLAIGSLFAGVSGSAFSQTLPSLRAEFGLTREQSGQFIAWINIGQILSYLLVRWADRWGRRPIWLLALLGCAAMSLASGLSSGKLEFGLCQMGARIFLLSGPAVGGILAAEEFPVARRGLIVGIVLACGGFGGVLCAGLVPLLSRTAFGWRTVYLVGGLPLLLVLPGWRWLRESEHFLGQRTATKRQTGIWSIWSSGYGARVWQLAAVFF